MSDEASTGEARIFSPRLILLCRLASIQQQQTRIGFFSYFLRCRSKEMEEEEEENLVLVLKECRIV